MPFSGDLLELRMKSKFAFFSPGADDVVVGILIRDCGSHWKMLCTSSGKTEIRDLDKSKWKLKSIHYQHS